MPLYDLSFRHRSTFCSCLVSCQGAQFKSSAGVAAVNIQREAAFLERIEWVGESEPSVIESEDLWQILLTMREEGPEEAIPLLDQFCQQRSQSAWTPSLRNNLADYYMRRGGYSRALSHWGKAWELLKNNNLKGDQKIKAQAASGLVSLLTRLGRIDELIDIFIETEGDYLDAGPFYQRFAASIEATKRMIKEPGIAFRCGSLALANLAVELGVPEDTIKKIRKLRSPETGFSLKTLKDIADENNLNLTPVKTKRTGDIIAPSVAYWKTKHYAAILAVDGKYCYVVDPTFGEPGWLLTEYVKEEVSGYFLVPNENVDGEMSVVSSQVSETIYGKGYPTDYGDEYDSGICDDGDPDNKDFDQNNPISSHNINNQTKGGEGCGPDGGPCEGMAGWYVSEPFMTLWIKDTPIFYTQSNGSKLSFQLMYKHRNTRSTTYTFGFGDFWEANFIDFVDEIPGPPTSSAGAMSVNKPYGGARKKIKTDNTYENPHFRGKMLFGNPSGSQWGYILGFPSESNAFLGYKQTFTSGDKRYYRTKAADRFGNTLTYHYTTTSNNVVQLTSITDYDGSSTTFNYGTGADENKITKITTPDGKDATFSYDSNDRLEYITDAVSIESQFVYDSSGFIEELITPYGMGHRTTEFELVADLSVSYTNDVVNRAIAVTHPDGSEELSMYRNDSYYLNSSSSERLMPYEDDHLPSGSIPILPGSYTLEREVTGFSLRNSFHWGIKNYGKLLATNSTFESSRDFDDLTREDYSLAKVKHWLEAPAAGTASGSLEGVKSIEFMPHPDAPIAPSNTGYPVEWGQIVWYDYEGQDDPWELGSAILPRHIAYTLPNGDTRFTRIERRTDRQIDKVVESYTNESGTLDVREFDFQYNGDNQLTKVLNDDAEVLLEYKYTDSNWPRHITQHINARGDVTDYTYDSSTGRLIKRELDGGNGLVTLYTYTSGWLTGITDKNFDETATLRSVSFTYTDGRVSSFTDALGYTKNYTYDHLDRITRIDHPGSLYELITYDVLDVSSYSDRLGNTTYYYYDSMRNLTQVKDPRNNSTYYDFCGCGLLNAVTNALSQVTEFEYDSNARLVEVTFPNSDNNVYTYSKNGWLTGFDDGKGLISYSYNNQGLIEEVENDAGSLLSVYYDAMNHPVEVTNPSGITIDFEYNNAGQLLTKSMPDGGETVRTYNQRGLSTFEYKLTSLVSKTTSFGFDELGRRVAVTNANSEVVLFDNNDAGNLTKLTNGLGNVTTWMYDSQGRVTNELDSASVSILQYGYDDGGRLDWRWSKGKGPTYYTYDANGNVTGVDFSAGTGSTDTTYAYDELNRLTNMVDAVGTTAFAYNNRGLLSSENGPWSSDTVSYTYVDGYLDEMRLERPSASDWVVEYGYDSSTRLDEIISPVGTFSYDYVGATYQIDDLTMPGSKFIDYEYDSVGRLEDTILKTSEYGSIINRHDYEFNLAGWRTKQTFTGGNYTDYDYDDIGQLIESDESGAGDLNEYAYDAAWNLDTKTLNSGTPSNFDVNSNNELTVSPLTSTNIYDNNGNLILDGVNYYAYDAEDQLVYREFAYTASIDLKFVYSYDGLRRLKQKLIHYYVNDSYVTTETVRYVYDGKLSIQERDGSNAILATYTRGLDLSGSLSGAGGIGGLLARSWSSNNALYHSDALGNVSTLINSSGTVKAQYTYDPFGYTTSQSGAWASANPYRFSSKEIDYKYFAGGDNYYYGYRFYHPVLHRWLNRDPIGINGGINLYGFVLNQPTGLIDIDGLIAYDEEGHVILSPNHTYGASTFAYDDETLENHNSIMNDVKCAAGQLAMAAAMLNPIPGDELALGAALGWKAKNILKAAKKPLMDQMSPDEAARYRKYWEKHAPEASKPYDTHPRYTEDGKLKQVTTYDEFEDRHRQYDLIDPRRPEHQHNFDYDSAHPRPKGARSDHLPIDE